jgi:hypothetical protein
VTRDAAEGHPAGFDQLPSGVRAICEAIGAGRAMDGLTPLRAEHGKQSFRAVRSDGAAAEACFIKVLGPRGPVDAALLQHLRPVPGRRYARSAEALCDAGLATPRVLHVVRVPQTASYLLVMELVPDAWPLRDVLRGVTPADRDLLFRMIGRAIARMHRAGVFHFDLNEDNLLFHEIDGAVSGPVLVDLDYTVRADPRRTRLCRLLARLDIRQLLTVRLVPITSRDGDMLAQGYREPDAPRLHIAWPADRSGHHLGEDAHVPPPRWKRYVGGGLTHLLRGTLLVCRLVH